ncbi:TPA: acyl-CoA synthetase [candidate division CPR2 bacterium]|uniref:Acetyl coenzyme A synthase alpha subunit n=1 Tax=candidate division CPR2 bacterium GW2011_GWC1_41_48 TaxID=1618344 RepID=A0A0G0Z7W6_UNCC2|nr:MAG: Acetyl coenzyme A synthase alpha subunit [candidate division CPR2 bacterium GW2011_GWC2_39_35]KKS09103.1 MAG: Acetyl coenzyme A synthase alpha subunit [candidate division CPR2 bacterium GW2011_GWC1_41_48]HBG81824.1 acyl-CoA synthetase [candidate division CPR2 bacterium]HCM00004.1 acyl-CoA synthetase [candidate division CPR2 bacterium]
MKKNLLFQPKSIAIIGASRDPDKLGFLVLANIKRYGFRGKIYPVNPKAEEILGYKCYQTIHHIPDSVDMAVILVPAFYVPEVLEQCGIKGIKTAIIISAGFGEIGGKGKELERQIKEIANDHQIRVLGPNCLGYIDTFQKLNASFAQSMPEKNNIAVFSQSGAVCTAILDWANANDIGFSRFVSLGNKADIDESDLFQEWENDNAAKVILGYLEGISEGDNFIRFAKKITAKKPLIVLKAGITSAGAKAAASHTGSLAGSETAVSAAFKKAGIIRAYNLEELFDYAKVFAFEPLLKGNKIAIIANAGGPSVMTADAIFQSKLELAKLNSITKAYLERKLPKMASINNPVDLVGDAKADRYKIGLEAVLADKNVDGVIVIATPQITTEVKKTAEVIVAMQRKYKKPVIASFMGGKKISEGVKVLAENKIPTFDFPERAVRAFEAMFEYSEYLDRKDKTDLILTENINKDRVNNLLREAHVAGIFNLGDSLDSLAAKILRSYGVNVAKSQLTKNTEEAAEAAQSIGFPVVLKITSQDILHKTDVGGVKIGLNNKTEVKEAFKEIMASVNKKMPEARIEGITVYHMVRKGQEVIVGGKRDPIFGPVIVFGLGGIMVELIHDVAFRIAPVTKKEALEMIAETKSSKLLQEFRGGEAYDIDAISDTIIRLSKLMTDFPEIEEVDINPLRVNERNKGVIALDVKMVLKYDI